MDKLSPDIAKALGMEPVRQPATRTKKVDVSQAIKLRYQKGLTFQQIAELQGVTTSAIFQALGPYRNLLNQTGPTVSDDSMGELLSAAATVHLAASVDPEKIAKMSGRDNAVAAGIFLDKSRLYKGQATSHTSVFFHVVSESDHANRPQDIDISPQNTPPSEDYLD